MRGYGSLININPSAKISVAGQRGGGEVAIMHWLAPGSQETTCRITVIDPLSRPQVKAGSYLCFCPFVPTFQALAKQNSFQVKIVIATFGTLSLAERIIDDPCLVYYHTTSVKAKGLSPPPLVFFPIWILHSLMTNHFLRRDNKIIKLLLRPPPPPCLSAMQLKSHQFWAKLQFVHLVCVTHCSSNVTTMHQTRGVDVNKRTVTMHFYSLL